MIPGDLVQIKKGIQGRGEIGVLLGPTTAEMPWYNLGLVDVLFSDGIRHVHPANLQRPDGRLKPLR